jgi:superfamily I DNA and/or RNA helicase
MNLHKAFVENSVQMRVQLDTFSKLLNGILTKEELNKYSGLLFQSFMLVVPVISTTFASVGSFLRYVDREEFGLLLIDEAGQAFPQSAPGAIWRAKKVIVVGDPMQIDPVVTIHDITIKYLKQYFQQTDFIASKETSVQSLADEANIYVGYRTLGEREFYIGSPLLVHGRCQRKIFDIANKIAYNNKMIYGTKDINNPICEWIHVHGQALNKHFVPAQAEQIFPLVKREFLVEWERNGMDSIPSLFIISPFRSVKSGLIRYFRNSDYLYRELNKVNRLANKKAVNKWIYSNIGTVHTFQGKEAKTVIICLGVDSGAKGQGAIKWASSKPNILNVAVTRAKDNLYIVGDATKWSSQDFFTTAYEICAK